MSTTLPAAERGQINGRQIAFFAAFVLPVYKLVETPSLLAGFVQGDILLPALLHFLLETAVLVSVLFVISHSEKSLIERFSETLGRWVKPLYALLSAFFLLTAVLPILDLEKFVYAVFYDTAPTIFSFAFFFLFAGFLATKGVRALGRFADLALFLFLVPFLLLIVMSLVEADFSHLLPLFEKNFGDTMYAMNYTKAHFIDVALLFPLLMNLRFQKGDGVKIATGYGVGAVLTALFLAVFYALFSSIAPREHYAFTKIAQYFPVLSVVGRIDLLLVYLLCITLFVGVATPLHYTVHFLSDLLPVHGKTLPATIICLLAFIFTLFCNKYYNRIYAFFGNALPIVFYVFDFAPTLILLLLCKKKKESAHA